METSNTNTLERGTSAKAYHVETDLREAFVHAIRLAAGLQSEPVVSIWYRRNDPRLHVGITTVEKETKFVGDILWLTGVEAWESKERDTHFSDGSFYEKRILTHYDRIDGDRVVLGMGRQLTKAGVTYNDVRFPYRAQSDFTPMQNTIWHWLGGSQQTVPIITTGCIRRSIRWALEKTMDMPSTYEVILWLPPQAGFLRSDSAQDIRIVRYNRAVIEPIAALHGWRSFLMADGTYQEMGDALQCRYEELDGDQLVSEIRVKLIEKGITVEEGGDYDDDDLPF